MDGRAARSFRSGGMTRRSSKEKRLPAVGAVGRRSTAFEAGANPTYGTVVGAGKRFRSLPVLTGNNSRRDVTGANDDEHV